MRRLKRLSKPYIQVCANLMNKTLDSKMRVLEKSKALSFREHNNVSYRERRIVDVWKNYQGTFEVGVNHTSDRFHSMDYP